MLCFSSCSSKPGLTTHFISILFLYQVLISVKVGSQGCSAFTYKANPKQAVSGLTLTCLYCGACGGIQCLPSAHRHGEQCRGDVEDTQTVTLPIGHGQPKADEGFRQFWHPEGLKTCLRPFLGDWTGSWKRQHDSFEIRSPYVCMYTFAVMPRLVGFTALPFCLALAPSLLIFCIFFPSSYHHSNIWTSRVLHTHKL